MTHPDLGILYAALGAAILLGADTRKHLIRYALPFVVIYVPYFAWRYFYYGDLFPNTYYAKSANLTYYSQGGVYLSSLLIGGGFWAALPLIGYGAWAQRRTLFGRYCLIGMPLFCVYVAKIGGDFMYGRLLCPIIPPLLVLCELGVARLLEQGSAAAKLRRGGTKRHHAVAALAALSITVVAAPVRLITPFQKTWEIADERTFYTLASLHPIEIGTVYFRWAHALLRYFPSHAPSPHLSMYSAGVISYYTGWPMLDGFGLTDRMIAHRPITARGRPGHEKHASAAYVVSRGVDISDEPTWPPAYAPLTRLKLDGFVFNLVHYDPKVMARLEKKSGVNFVDYERRLASQVRVPVTARNADRIACDAWFAEEYYFSRVPKSPLRVRVERQLLNAGRAFDAVPPVPNQSVDLNAPRVMVGTAFHFEPAEQEFLECKGDAFRAFPTTAVPISQEWVTGQRGAYASTFDAERGDSARGRLRSKPFTLVGDVMELRVGGGAHSPELRVSLIVDGMRMFSAGGCDSEMMGRRLWQIAPFKGKQAMLEIVDKTSGWVGHVMVDEVVQWSPATTP
jgi:hypothetical protein